MSRALCQIPIAFALGIANLGWAAPPGGSGAQSVDHLLRLRFRVYATLPAGSVIICSARLEGAATKSRPDETVSGAAAVVGSSSTCAVEIPVSRTGNRPCEEEVLRYEIESEEHPGMALKMIAAGTAALATTPSGPGDLDLAMQIPSAR